MGPRAQSLATGKVAGEGDAPALLLARRLPVGEDRCSVAQPSRLAESERGLLALVSQSEPLPWALDLPVAAYARAERAPSVGERAVVEYVTFVGTDRARIEADLAQALDRPLRWSDRAGAGDGCHGELTCTELAARFIEPHTVELTHGQWGEPVGAVSACLRALRSAPLALEVSARSALLGGTELRDSRALLEQREDGLLRTTFRRYAEADAAERALREALRGHDELSTLAGVPATSLGERDGELIALTTFASFADLRLAAEDRVRASALLLRTREPRPLEQVDPSDADAVRATFDALLEAFRARPVLAQLDALSQLLERARALHPEDAGLARRHYQLALSLRHDARAALAIASSALRQKLDDESGWQLRVRAALAELDETRLRAALSSAHQLGAALSLRMAREVSERVHAGQDYERAEWAFLAAHRLSAQRPRKLPLSLRLPLAELPRLLAYLGQSVKPQLDLGVHVLAHAEHLRAAEVVSSPEESALWIAETTGGARPGVMFAATSWDDGQLRALGRALARRSEDGALELVVGLAAIGAKAESTQLFLGRREGASLVVEHVSSSLARLAWPRIERLLARPLVRLTGSTFPPDELAIETSDRVEAAQVVSAAESVSSVKCSLDGPMVRCHGAMADQTAARRALLAVTARLLADEARSLWSGTD